MTEVVGKSVETPKLATSQNSAENDTVLPCQHQHLSTVARMIEMGAECPLCPVQSSTGSEPAEKPTECDHRYGVAREPIYDGATYLARSLNDSNTEEWFNYCPLCGVKL